MWCAVREPHIPSLLFERGEDVCPSVYRESRKLATIARPTKKPSDVLLCEKEREGEVRGETDETWGLVFQRQGYTSHLVPRQAQQWGWGNLICVCVCKKVCVR